MEPASPYFGGHVSQVISASSYRIPSIPAIWRHHDIDADEAANGAVFHGWPKSSSAALTLISCHALRIAGAGLIS